MALKLYLNYDKTEQLQECDLYPDEGISIKQKLISATGLLNTTIEFTKDFLIPASGRNNGLLGQYQSKDVVSPVNPNKSIPARIEIDGAKVYYGAVEILSVSWKKGRPYNYKIVFYGSASGLKVDLGSTRLKDIDWSAFEMVMTDTNIEMRWRQNINTFVPIISWVRAYRHYDTAITPANPNDIGVNGVLIDEQRVGLRLKDFVETIFNHIGAAVTFDTKISDHLTDAYIFPSDAAVRTLSQVAYDVNVKGDNLLCTNGARHVMILPTVTNDPSSSWTSSKYYTAKYTGKHTFKIDIAASTAALMDFYCVKDTGNVPMGTASLANQNGSVFLTVNLVKNDVYRFESERSLAGADITYSARLTTYKIPVTLYDETYDPSLYMPDMLASEFISKFLKAFNLDIITESPNVYEIKDIVSVFNYDEIIDLNDYINQEILTYDKIDVYGEIDLKHKEGGDIGNKDFKSAYNDNYGSYVIEPDYEFADGVLEVESIFTVFPPNYIYSYNLQSENIGPTNMIQHYQLDEGEPPKAVEAKFLLLYKNGKQTANISYLLQSGIDAVGNATFTSYDTYGAYSQVQDFVSTPQSNTLAYGLDLPPVGVTAEKNLYNVFWKELTEQLYDNAAYKIKVSFQASFGVYYKLTKSSLCFFKGFYHFISQFEYKTADHTVTLELTKIKVTPNTFIIPPTSGLGITTEDSNAITTEDSNKLTTE